MNTLEPKRPLNKTWKYFIAAWLFPILAIAQAVAEDYGHQYKFVYPLLSILFVAAFLCYAIPYMCRKLSFRDAALFGTAAPFGIWVLAVTIKLVCFGK